ncbi:MAG: PIN domain-containing protein [Marinobacter sp.]|nr:PIN domain-containing protein [Marinobacter sp.]MDX5336332.1 PIN domain-containing protein [Marinobacter sp.]MDX5472758.1 PIN domain-containing protein [Marinobacter sp.]
MQLLISDANILIDLEEGGLLKQLFGLPYEFQVPDILFYEELEDQHGYLVELGLGLGELDEEGMRSAFEYTRKYNGPSRNDCFALALARQERCPLLTGDKALRKAAEKEAILVNGTLWVVEQLVIHSVVTIDQARNAYQRMKSSGRRLPWAVALQRLEAL